MTNAEKALEYIGDGMAVGLGSGHASQQFIEALGKRVQAGLKIRGVPTSSGSAALAARFGIPLVALADALPLDLTVDGADEVDTNLDMIKGYGHALVREKIVAASSKRLVILIGPEHIAEKRVSVLGSRGKLPVEVIPFALALCQKCCAELGIPGQLLMADGKPFVTDNGNFILECKVSAIRNPGSLDQQLLAIPGVVGTGLFIGMADAVLAQDGDRLEILNKK